MDLIFAIYRAYATVNQASIVVDSVVDWVITKVNKWSLKASDNDVEKQVEAVGRATEAEIRAAADKVFGKDSPNPLASARREELIGLMLNMSRNVRGTITSAGPSGSSGYLRSEALLDRLLHDVEPVRHAGEHAAPGSPWVLKRHLGMGSFGEVWLAENKHFPTPRAFKFFTREGAGEWLRRERDGVVALLRRLGPHASIVELEDVHVDDCPHPFLVFEYVGGGSLEDWIVRPKAGRPPIEVGEIVRQAAEALAAIHKHDVTHRDIKPANLLLTSGPDPRVKVADLGLARVGSTARDRGSRSMAAGSMAAGSMAGGGGVGTPMYLPPEALMAGGRSRPKQLDVFALGVVWYQLLTGQVARPPYDLADELKALGVDPYTVDLIGRCLARPDRRFRDAGELVGRLEGALPTATDRVEAGVPDVQHLALAYLAAGMASAG